MDSQLQEKKDILSFLTGGASDIQQVGSDVHRHQGQSPAMFQFPPSSPPSPQHALGTHLSRQSQSTRTHSQSRINTDMLGDLLPIHGLESNLSQPISVTSTSPMAMGGAGLAYNPHLLLDHQFRLTQFQQLQQLQQQIFQQQMALISGQMLNGSSAMESQRNHFIYNELPTPAPSGELRPQQQSLDFISPMVLNNFVDGTSQSHRQSHPSSPSLHSGTSSMMDSPAFIGNNNVQTEPPQSSNYSSTTYVHPGSISAPEYIAFQTSPHPSLCSSADLDLDISPLTSPWLGAQQNHQMLSFQCQNQNSRQQQQQQQQHPHMGGTQHSSGPVVGPKGANFNHKRSASPSPAESDARKKQSPAVRPTHPSTFAQQLDQTRRSHRTGSRSTTSTPLLRARSGSTRQRKGSIASALNAPAAINEVPGDSPSPVDLSMPPPAPPAPSNPVAVSSGANSVPPSPAMGPSQQNNGPSHLIPVTPASFMNLDMNGKRLKVVTDSSSNSGVSTSPASHRSKRNVQGISGGTSLISPNLKPILPGPAGNSTPLLPITTSAISGGHSSVMSTPPPSTLHPQVRKTSHKAAEQKRRDSLKTTFDELRVLLPPIPIPSTSANTGDGEDGVAAGSSGTGGSTGNIFSNAVKPLLPGALPPRGPPKAGGEGPNKGVSKLQLLICGNEYIKTLKGRVERRNEEINRLRHEVKKLRTLMGVPGDKEAHGLVSGGSGDGVDDAVGDPYMMGVAGLMEQLDLDLDLDRDIDDVENMPTTGGKDDTLSSARSDLAIDEDEDED
ncbi:hypothetical protein APHAL10511_005828 [Amanita phalloides]|nr:hypothetical protein APHAL10511_005828 [Amanita phalloides]